VVIIPFVFVHDSIQTYYDLKSEFHRYFAEQFQAAVDDAGAYLGRLEAQQITSGVRYHREKQLETDMDVLNVFFSNLALKFGIENNPIGIQTLKIHMPAMVLFRYNGYVLVTLDDSASSNGQHEFTPVFWPIRPYTYTLQNGNVIYFTLDDQATVYDKSANTFFQGNYEDLIVQTNLSPLDTLDKFREIRNNSIVQNVENDIGGAINRHLELVKRMDLNIQFSIPRGLAEQSIQDIGFMAFVQGYPLPNGELFDGFALGSGAVLQRKTYIGTITTTGQHVAYEKSCVPSSGITVIENLFDPEEAVKKGYFIYECGYSY
jgi:hypothetical protein